MITKPHFSGLVRMAENILLISVYLTEYQYFVVSVFTDITDVLDFLYLRRVALKGHPILCMLFGVRQYVLRVLVQS
jgi:hypothetical protein